MKIGIMTFWWTTSNYGQVLQAFALKNALSSLGNEVYFIRYQGIPAKADRSIFEKLINFSPVNYLKIKSRKRKLLLEESTNPRYFDVFKNKYLKFSDNKYNSLAELKLNPPEADVYICGSDQVWNNSFAVSCEAYFLGFGDDKVRRIAYAASFGQSELSAADVSLFKRNLSRFDAISVREKSGVELCRKCGANEVEWVPDPTLLFDKSDWLNFGIVSNVEIDSHLLMYTLGNSPIPDKIQFLDYAKQLYPDRFYHVTANQDYTGNFYPTVGDWLGYISKADFIITNSFHGMVFCIIFNRNFVVLPNTGSKSGMNERIFSLLEKCNLSDHIMDHFDESKLDALRQGLIDWQRVNERLVEWREYAFQFLNKVLN